MKFGGLGWGHRSQGVQSVSFSRSSRMTPSHSTFTHPLTRTHPPSSWPPRNTPITHAGLTTQSPEHHLIKYVPNVQCASLLSPYLITLVFHSTHFHSPGSTQSTCSYYPYSAKTYINTLTTLEELLLAHFQPGNLLDVYICQQMCLLSASHRIHKYNHNFYTPLSTYLDHVQTYFHFHNKYLRPLLSLPKR